MPRGDSRGVMIDCAMQEEKTLSSGSVTRGDAMRSTEGGETHPAGAWGGEN